MEGINLFGNKQFIVETYDIDDPLPALLDDTPDYLPQTMDADIVPDFLKHRDLSDDLSSLCERLNIPMVTSGKRKKQAVS